MANVARQWLVPGRRDFLIPRGALAPEKRLFHTDAEMLLAEILLNAASH